MSADITKKKRIKVGHKASVAKITAQMKTELGALESNPLRLQQLRKKLQEKSELIRTLDDEILSKMEEEDEIWNHIEQADAIHDEVEYALILLDKSLAVTDKEALGEVTQKGISHLPRAARTDETSSSRESENGMRAVSTPEPGR